VTEIPYQVNLSTLTEKIAELVRDKKIEGIRDLRNESDRDGMRLVVELKRDAKPDVVKRNLLKQTQLQTTFGVNMLALVKNQPRLLTMADVIHEFIEHRVTVVVRRTQFELRRAEARAHILAGLLIAIGDMDNIIKLIRAAASAEVARQELQVRYSLDLDQANAILEMQLRRLTGLERDKITNEYEQLRAAILEFKAILASRVLVLAIIKEELVELREKFGDERKTTIVPAEDDGFSIEALTPNEAMAVFITEQGYIKRIAMDTFERQNRATRGKGAMKTREEDDVTHFFTAGMHNAVLFFTSRGVAHSLKVYELPEGSRQAKGLAMINLLPLNQDESITAVVPVSNFAEDQYLVMLSRDGWVKKISKSHFESIRRNGLIAASIEQGDALLWVMEATDEDTLFISTQRGMAIRFKIGELRAMGRTARGITSIHLRTRDVIVSADVLPPNESDPCDILFVTNDGYGKRVDASEFRIQNRGGIGLISTKFKRPTSQLSTTCVVKTNDEIMLASSQGVVVRINATDISRQGRTATGVRVMNMDDADTVSSVTKIVALEEEENAYHAPEASEDAATVSEDQAPETQD
jgi:DNA gyrase subunit A